MAGFIARHRGAFVGLLLFGLAWAAAAARLAAAHSDDLSDAVVVLAVFGIILPGVAWLTTLGTRPPPIPVARPGFELGVVLAYLAAYAVLFTGYGLNAFHAALPDGRLESVLLVALKLVVHVALPCLVLLWAGVKLKPLFATPLAPRAFWLTLAVIGAAVLALLSVISPSLKQIAGLRLGPGPLALASAAAFVWIAVEAGFCEEFLFRAVLQSRLAPVMKSELGAAFVGALLFGLAHVPGLWMRSGVSVAGHSQDLGMVIAYAVAVLAPAGLFFGILWARTRNLLLLALLHAAVDVLPFIPEFAHRWL